MREGRIVHLSLYPRLIISQFLPARDVSLGARVSIASGARWIVVATM